jgi:hypothetical protein
MPQNNTSRETHTVEELVQIVREWDALIDGAVPNTREHTEHVNARRHYARCLEVAQENEAERERDEKRPAKEIAREVVDRMMNDR